MAMFNEEFVKKMAHGDEKAAEIASKLSPSEKISLGMVVDAYREKENIVPIDNGFTVYQKQNSPFIDNDAVGESVRLYMERQKAEERRQLKLHEERIAEQTRLNIERSRAGLRQNNKLRIK